MEKESIDEIAHWSDEQVVAARFDARNAQWLRSLLLAMICVVGLQAMIGFDRHDLARSINPLINLVVVFILRRVIRPGSDTPAAQLLRRHMTALVISYIAAQLALAVSATPRTDSMIVWGTVMPFSMIGFRLRTLERALMHGIGTAVVVIGALVAPHDVSVPSVIWAVGTVNVTACVIGITAARRQRLSILEEWHARRDDVRDRLRMRDELRYARELQLSILPAAPPDVGWLDLCATSIPATEVGGDYYDFFVRDQSVAIICGDVAGHGMASGLVLAALRAGFALLHDSLGDPAAVLSRLHEMVLQTSRRRMLVTVSLALVDRDAQSVTVASAGHPPLLLRRATDGSVTTIDLFAPPLGVRLPVTIPHTRIGLAPGDVLLLHTDGIYESTSPHGESFGIERIASILRSWSGVNIEELRDRILREVTDFRGGLPQSDDITLVVARMADGFALRANAK